MKLAGLFGFFVWSFCIHAQESKLEVRHAQIEQAYENEAHQLLIDLVDEQLLEVAETTWTDSLHTYVYKYCRSVWKLSGEEAAQVAAKDFENKVIALTSSVEQRLKVLGRLSWLYFDLGLLQKCLVSDSIAAELAMSSPNVSPLIRGKALHYVGFDQSFLGNYGSALPYFTKAVEELGKADTLYRVETSASLNGVGTCHWEMGDTRKAEGFFLRAIEVLGDFDDLTTIAYKASAYGNLALVADDDGDLLRSKKYLTKNIGIQNYIIETATDPAERDEGYYSRSISYGNMAVIYFSMGDLGKAKELLDRATQDRERVRPVDDPLRYMNMERYADILNSSGQSDSALKVLDSYQDIIEDKVPHNGRAWIRLLSKRGVTLKMMGRNQEAVQELSEAIDSQLNSVGGERDVELPYYLIERATAYQNLKQFSKALDDIHASRNYRSDKLGRFSEKVAKCDISLVEIHLEKGDMANAQIALDSLLLFFEHVDPGAHSHTLSPSIYHLPAIRYAQVKVMRAQGNTSIKEQLELLEDAVLRISSGKVELSDDESKLAMYGGRAQIFRLYKELLLEAERAELSGNWSDEILRVAELNNSVLLRSRLSEFSGLSFSNVPDSLVSMERRLKSAISLQEDSEVTTDLLEQEKQYAEILALFKERYPTYYKTRFGDDVVSIEDLREALVSENRTFVLFSQIGETMAVLVVTPSSSEIYELPWDSMDVKVISFNDAIRTFNIEQYVSLAHELYKDLVVPWYDGLSGHELLIVPDGILHYLNFECLLTSQSSASNYYEHFLLEENVVSYLLSATTAVQFDQLDKGQGNGVFALAPGFSDDLKKYYAEMEEDGEEDVFDISGLVQQPFTLTSAQSLSGHFESSLILTGGDAHEQNFKEHAGEYGIIHLGTHAEVNNSSPLYSRFILGRSADEDGYLHTYELYELDLNAELAVLTACETGIGKQYSSEGLRSLAHGFAYAGCPSLVMSLWKIDEKSSSQILDGFYENLSEGLAKNVALNRAKQDFIQNAQAELRFPFYWAGLELLGDHEPIESQDIPFSNILVFALLILLILVILFFVKRRR